MKLNKLLVLAFLLGAGISVFADIALPKPTATSTITKYYFANVDSFANYKFFVKKLSADKTYKLKQSASFLIDPNASVENNKLEVWAVNRSSNQMSNTFILEGINSKESFEDNTAHVAVVFTFDKKGKLTYKTTVMKPECFNKKKELIPFLSFDISNNKMDGLLLISLLALFALFVMNIANLRKAYA